MSARNLVIGWVSDSYSYPPSKAGFNKSFDLLFSQVYSNTFGERFVQTQMKTREAGFQELLSGVNLAYKTRHTNLDFQHFESSISLGFYSFSLFTLAGDRSGCIRWGRVLGWKIFRKKIWKTW